MFRVCFLIILLILNSCTEEKQEKKPIIAVTNYPLYWLVDNISDNSFEIIYNVSKDIDPAYWEPKDNDILNMQRSDMILINGATYEKWLPKVELPYSKIVNTLVNHEDKFIKIKNADVHEHNGVMHSHDSIDFNTWLDPEILNIQSQEVLRNLIKLKPSKADEFRKNQKILMTQVADIFQKINEVSTRQQNYFGSHPVYNYLARVNGWKVKSFHWEPQVVPSDNELKKLKDEIKHSKFILYEDTPSPEVRKKLEDLGIQIIVFRTAGNTPPSNDFIQEMKVNYNNLRISLSP
jgi:zinc transport system substrate-binding protein